MNRIGQVTGLAALQLRMLLLLGAALLFLVVAGRYWRDLALRLACAAVAGLATGVTAAGTVIALRGTAWPLNGQGGDAGALQRWAQAYADGRSPEGIYPPLYPQTVAWFSQIAGHGHIGYSLKVIEIVFTALIGPVAYLSWRLLLKPLWALGIGVTAALPLVTPYKPYPAMVLIALVPVIGKLFQLVQNSAELSRRRAASLGAGLGVLLAGLVLLYSGWFVWSALGVVVGCAVLLAQVWRRSSKSAAVTGVVALAAAAITFLVLAGNYLVQLLSGSGDNIDRFCYFDVYTEPTYFAMWRDDLPGADAVGTWPPPGELGGVGLFTIVLLLGLGVALALGLRRPPVLAAALCVASAFLLRYWYASHMVRDQAVMLYPRTTAQIVYCMLVLTGLAAWLVSARVRAWAASRAVPGTTTPGTTTPGAATDRRGRPSGWLGLAVGTVCALGLLFASAGSATASRYMPEDPKRQSAGMLAWRAHTLQEPNGNCSAYAPNGRCGTPGDLSRPAPKAIDSGRLGCDLTPPVPARLGAPVPVRLVAGLLLH